MLILTRKKGQSIVINNNIEIFVASIEGEQVKIGIKAPEEINIYRKEVLDAIQASNKEAAQSKPNLAVIRSLVQSKKNDE
ncbi:carbon storage regulator CsrA [Paenibacillus sp. NPDC056579]|uniref:carbon storage regulator CsrA n=1 Tax=Paenibacillus sp. NPDC056579 TaxID=3345871 RepID=UPI00367AD4AB